MKTSDGETQLQGDGKVRRGFRVRGRVQGVGFRWWTRREAQRLGVAGTVRNLDDGVVEVMAVAGPETMERFLAVLSVGPPVARVDSMEETAYRGARDPGGFGVER